jgi:hypothetical protein
MKDLIFDPIDTYNTIDTSFKRTGGKCYHNNSQNREMLERVEE